MTLILRKTLCETPVRRCEDVSMVAIDSVREGQRAEWNAARWTKSAFARESGRHSGQEEGMQAR